jgi:hypothetical protein
MKENNIVISSPLVGIYRYIRSDYIACIREAVILRVPRKWRSVHVYCTVHIDRTGHKYFGFIVNEKIKLNRGKKVMYVVFERQINCQYFYGMDPDRSRKNHIYVASKTHTTPRYYSINPHHNTRNRWQPLRAVNQIKRAREIFFSNNVRQTLDFLINQLCVRVYVCISISVCMYVCISVSVCACVCVYISVSVCECMCVCVCVCARVNILCISS